MKLKLLKAKWMTLSGLISSVFVFLDILFIFLVGTQSTILPEALTSNRDAINLVISLIHTLSVVFAIPYFMSFWNTARYDRKIIGTSVVSSIIYFIGIFLVFRCYVANDYEPLIFIITINGILMLFFAWLLSAIRYRGTDRESERITPTNLMLKIFSISGIVLYILAVFTYYGYLSKMMASYFRVALRATDAVSLYLYMIGAALIILSFVVMFVLEVQRRLKRDRES